MAVVAPCKLNEQIKTFAFFVKRTFDCRITACQSNFVAAVSVPHEGGVRVRSSNELRQLLLPSMTSSSPRQAMLMAMVSARLHQRLNHKILLLRNLTVVFRRLSLMLLDVVGFSSAWRVHLTAHSLSCRLGRYAKIARSLLE